jgi:hypothetical protein
VFVDIQYIFVKIVFTKYLSSDSVPFPQRFSDSVSSPIHFSASSKLALIIVFRGRQDDMGQKGDCGGLGAINEELDDRKSTEGQEE